jgi:acetyl esterase
MWGLAQGYEQPITLNRLAHAAPPTLEGLDALRLKTAARARRFGLTAVEGVHIGDVAANGHRRWRTLAPAHDEHRSHVFYVHGGGFIFYSVDDFTPFLSHAVSTAGCSCTAFDYPKAPEHDVDDIIAAIEANVERRLAELPSGLPIVGAGDSVGAFVALLRAVRRFPGRFSRLVLIYPVLDMVLQRASSYEAFGRGYCLNTAIMTWIQSIWAGGRRYAAFSPFALTADDLRSLPEIVLFSAEADVLRDEAFEWTECLRRHGVAIRHEHLTTLAHDFCLYAGVVPDARRAVHQIAAAFGPGNQPRSTCDADVSDQPL